MSQLHRHSRTLLPVLVMLLAMWGCSGGGTAIRYYVIDPVPGTGSSRDSTPMVVDIMDVHIPQYLERFNLVLRGDQNQLQFAELHQWGDNFRKNLLRTLALNLSDLLSTDDIGTPINRTMSVPDYRVQVHIEQFERNYDGHVKLLARWQVMAASTKGTVSTYRTEIVSSSVYSIDDYPGIVAAMQDLYGQFSRKLAESISDAGNNG